MWQACPSPAGVGTVGGDCVASDATGGEQGGKELARALMEVARAEEGRLGLLAAGRGAGRQARRREWQLVVVVVAAAAMATMAGVPMAVVVAVVAAERQRLPLGGCQDGSDGPWGCKQAEAVGYSPGSGQANHSLSVKEQVREADF